MFLVFLFVSVNCVYGQVSRDTVKTLEDVTIQSIRIQGIDRLKPVQDTYIFAGKKSEVINLSKAAVPLAEKYGRQIFAKIPGVFVYDMDGTGNQINISTRGLDPHRGWEFNIRKDGILTNTDMYGYPASHYNIPMEAVERIELVRGTGSLQYGAQFGGMLNYISKKPDPKRKFSYEGINTVGSFGLLSSFHAVRGTVGKFQYNVWINKKSSEGYRENSRSDYNAENVTLTYQPHEDLAFNLEWTHSNYVIQLAGPLTDSMFYADPQSATRSRNYYNPDIHIPSFTVDWKKNNTIVRFATSAVLGARNSVMFDRPATVEDSIHSSTLEYDNRQVDIDNYHSYTSELRLLQSYKFLNQTSSLLLGVQYMNNDLHRRQLGVGTTGTDFDLTLATPGWGRDIHFKTGNVAVFAENHWRLSKRFSMNAGVRWESGQSDVSGEISYYPENEIPNTIAHRFPLFGAGAEYQLANQIQLYGGWSQAYRPVIFKDIVPGSVYERVDQSLDDAYGYNAEVGVKGVWRNLNWDITGFHLKYDNRLGTLVQNENQTVPLLYRTNIGNSSTNGIELFLQSDFSLGNQAFLSLFTSSSWMQAHYKDAVVRSGNENINIEGNLLESVPEWISRSGITLQYDLASLNILYSYTSQSFADALNTVQPNASGSVGLVPAYQLLDINLGVDITPSLQLRLNLNNAFNELYFTKRPQFYPGPGIWPSDGRSFSSTLLLKL